MFNLAIDSKLRGCDVLAFRVEDIAPNGYAIDRATVRQKKTGRPVKFELTDQTRQAVDDYLKATGKKPGELLFTGRRGIGQSTWRTEEVRHVDSDTIAPKFWCVASARCTAIGAIDKSVEKRGTRPIAPRDQRTASTYIFGAVCPKDSDRDADVPCKTFEELDAAFKERGLPVERIYPMLNLQSFHQPEVEEPEDVE